MAKKSEKQIKNKRFSKYLNPKWIFLGSLIAILSIGLITTLLMFYLSARIYPLIYVGDINLSLLTPYEANQIVTANLQKRISSPVNFSYQSSTNSAVQSFEINLKNSIDLNTNILIEEAFQYGRTKFYTKKITLTPNVTFNQNYDTQIKSIQQSINQSPLESSIKVEGSQITVTPSQDGLELDEDRLKKTILKFISTNHIPESSLPVKIAKPKLSYSEGLEIKKRLDSINLSPLKLVFLDTTFTLDLNQLLTLIDLENTNSSLAQIPASNFNLKSIKAGGSELLDTKLTLNQKKVNEYLKKIAAQIDRPVQEPILSVDPSSDPGKPRITEFQPPIEGQKLDLEKSSQLLSEAMINQNQKTIELPVTVVKPKNKLTNDLGINELIGRGVSNFAGSIPNRIYNIELTAQKINGALVPPGEIFSFNGTIGDVSAENGYKQAYVIKSGRTVLDDGGGVCQDSTTVFRAALNAGLPILKRTAHAYRVGYYEQGFPPGLDATIFTPSVDFQFKNDTPSHILVQAYIRGFNLYIDLYGTSDGRTVEMTKPVILNQTPPPDPLYQDDPTLKRGTTKQVDFSAWGANVSFSRTVKRNGEVIIADTFKSNYRPWQAVYLVGTAE